MMIVDVSFFSNRVRRVSVFQNAWISGYQYSETVADMLFYILYWGRSWLYIYMGHTVKLTDW